MVNQNFKFPDKEYYDKFYKNLEKEEQKEAKRVKREINRILFLNRIKKLFIW